MKGCIYFIFLLFLLVSNALPLNGSSSEEDFPPHKIPTVHISPPKTAHHIPLIVYFVDHHDDQDEEKLSQLLEKAEKALHHASYSRRFKQISSRDQNRVVTVTEYVGNTTQTYSLQSASNIVDHRDLDIEPDYINAVLNFPGVTLRTRLKWFNAISVNINTFSTLYDISALPFVKSIHPVRKNWPKVVRRSFTIKENEKPISIQDYFPSTIDDYGLSFQYLHLMGFVEAHNKGYTGKNVTILVLDSGFSLQHSALRNTTVLAQRDFVNNDNNTEDQGNENSHYHGTAVLSLIAAQQSGVLYGGSFDSQFILAKTEDVDSETPVEEDYFAAAIEWGESLGADIATSSLGYSYWYEPEEFDGKTSIATLALEYAFEKGMVTVTSAGNYGPNRPTCPADGARVLSVGAVDPSFMVTSFSSYFQTADGRYKPDLMALGKNVPSAGNNNSISYFDGTSFSAPYVAAAAALLIEAHPDWTNLQIRDRLLHTSSLCEQKCHRDPTYGFGIIDAFHASVSDEYFCNVTQHCFEESLSSGHDYSQYNYNRGTSIHYYPVMMIFLFLFISMVGW